MSEHVEQPRERDSKVGRYDLLVKERKSCHICTNLTNPNDAALRDLDSTQIAPWTRWQGDLNADIMIVGQDWGGLKDGGDNGHLPAACFRECGRAFLRPQIEIVKPKVVVCLGREAYRATMRAHGMTARGTLREAVDSTERIWLDDGPEIVPVFHCGGLGRRNRHRAQQLLDWKRVKRALAPQPGGPTA